MPKLLHGWFPAFDWSLLLKENYVTGVITGSCLAIRLCAIVMTKPEDMDVKKILKIKNVEVRKEAIKKLGTTLLMEKLNYTVLDKKSLFVDDNNKVHTEKNGREIRSPLY